MLPNAPVMLLSVVNTKLRDRYASLEALCDDLDASEAEIAERLAQIGYHYSKERNQFV